MSHVLTLSALHLETKEILIQFGKQKDVAEQRTETRAVRYFTEN